MLFITFGRERKKTSENKSIRGVLAAKKPKQDKKKFLFGVFVREAEFSRLDDYQHCSCRLFTEMIKLFPHGPT